MIAYLRAYDPQYVLVLINSSTNENRLSIYELTPVTGPGGREFNPHGNTLVCVLIQRKQGCVITNWFNSLKQKHLLAF